MSAAVFPALPGLGWNVKRTEIGVEARNAAEATGSESGLLEMAVKAIEFIIDDAAKTFSGVFAFLLPEMGPAAAGPAAPLVQPA